MSRRTYAVLLVGIALGAGGASAGFLGTETSPTPALFTNSNGADVLRHPDLHIGAAVQYRGTVVGDHPLIGGTIIAIRIDGTAVGAHIYDPTWAPAYIGQPLEIQGRIRGVLGDPIDAAHVPIVAPLTTGNTLIDVTAATGPHQTRHARIRPATHKRPCHKGTYCPRPSTTSTASRSKDSPGNNHITTPSVTTLLLAHWRSAGPRFL